MTTNCLGTEGWIHVRHVARVVPVIVFSIGLVIGIQQLAVQNAVWSEVLTTGAIVFGAVIALFGLLIGAGKGLGLLVNRQRTKNDADES